jgi:hypothetical protein
MAMIVTEEEAKTKRCQESFGDRNLTQEGMAVHAPYPLSSSGFVSMSGYAVTTSPTHCIGSACMAWRWQQAMAADGLNVVTTDRGYCGKAGKP